MFPAIKAHVEKLGCWTWKDSKLCNDKNNYYIAFCGYSHTMQLRYEGGGLDYTEWRFNDRTRTTLPKMRRVRFNSHEQMLIDICNAINSI